MDTFTAYHHLTAVLYKRKSYPRLYVKEEPNYRRTRFFMTRLGFGSIALAAFTGLVLMGTISSVFH